MQKRLSKIVIDTNLWISFLITKDFHYLEDLIFLNKVVLIFSQELIDEFVEVTKRPKFKKYFNPDEIIKLLELFDTYGEFVQVSSNVKVCRDLKDNFILSLAVDGQADYLITGDSDLLELQSFGKTKILQFSDFKLIS